MTLNYWTGIINLLGAVQAVFFALFFFSLHEHQKANRLLSLICLSVGISIAGTVLGALEFYKIAPHLIRIGDPFTLLTPPLIWMYTKELTGKKSSTIDLLHLIPFASYLLLLMPFYLLPADKKIEAVDYFLNAKQIQPALLLIAVSRLISFASYLFLSLLQINHFKENLKQTYSSFEAIGIYLWQKILLILTILFTVQFVLFLFFAATIISLLQVNIWSGFLLTLMMYSMVYLGWKQRKKKPVTVFIEPEKNEKPGESISSDTRKTIKYQGSALTDEELAVYSNRLKELMETQKPYTEPDLTLLKLASLTGITPHLLSQVINQQFQQNFFDFINGYRIKEVTRLMQLPANQQFTILSIAFEAGFNSKTTFNQAFKKATGKTPSAYRDLLNQ